VVDEDQFGTAVFENVRYFGFCEPVATSEGNQIHNVIEAIRLNSYTLSVLQLLEPPKHLALHLYSREVSVTVYNATYLHHT
jgi:hypothetical protein